MASPLSFQAFTVRANGRLDRIITDIAVFPAFDPKTPPKPVPTPVKAKALWDTGATRSVIGQEVAKNLGVAAVGAVNVNHGGGSCVSPTYMVNLGLPNGVLIAGALVTEFPPPAGFNVIVGMDVIGLGDFSITNVSGLTQVSFRLPSCVAIDYVSEAQRIKFSGVGRNDPCPCGSTKKFKKCHGAAPGDAVATN